MPIDLRRAQPRRAGVLTAVLAGLVSVFALLAVLVAVDAEPLLDLDRTVADAAYDLTAESAGLLDVLEGIETLFSTWPVLGLMAALALYVLARGESRISLWIVLSAAAVLFGNPLVKQLFDRPRPRWDESLHEIGGWSFPSGHAAGAGLVATVLVLMTIIRTGRGLRRRLLIALWVVIGLTVAASRVLLGVHYLSDIVAGLCLGVFATLALWLVVATDATRIPAQATIVTGTGRKQAAVVLNPAKVGDVELFKAKVRLAASAHDWAEPAWFETTIEDPGYGQAVAALESGADLIVAAGGDGTIRAVCEEVARTGVAVGVIPQGTGNLLARNLGVPLNTRDALDVAFGGQDKAIDLARFRTDSGVETSFLVMAGLGMDAMIMTGVDPVLKERVGWLAYFVSGVKAVRFPGMRVEITVDDAEPRRFRAATVVIGNVGFLQGGIPLLPDAAIDDGRLDVVVIAPRRLLGWVSIVLRIVTRRRRTNERLDRMSGERVQIRSTSDVPMQLDGDPVGIGREIVAEVRPGVLLVRVPVLPVPLV